jgi:pimeloyl-ACP methyl ester carboxylesterase
MGRWAQAGSTRSLGRWVIVAARVHSTNARAAVRRQAAEKRMAQNLRWSEDRRLLLPDGRYLGYRTYGNKTDRPLFFMHGTPGSRFVLGDCDPLTKLPGTFIILAERPGYGLSTPLAGRTLVGWATDIRWLAAELGTLRYWVAGISGGAPHALACAYRDPANVMGAFLMSSPAPAEIGASLAGMHFGNRLSFLLTRHFPGLMSKLTAATARAIIKDPQGFMRKLAEQVSAPDRALMEAEPLIAAMLADLQEAYRQGPAGHVADAAVLASRSWGIDFSEIGPPVRLFHGETDRLVPLTMAEALHNAMPGSRLDVISGAGHLLTEYQQVVDELGFFMSERTGT